jgi:hypothetical protein
MKHSDLFNAAKLFTIILLSFSSMSAYATADSLIKQDLENGISYITGGVGDDESDSIKQSGKDFNLHITFSEGINNSYITGVKLIIRHKGGKTLLALDDVGPLIYLTLAAGQYDISASIGEHLIQRRITIKTKTTKNVQLHWNTEKNSE